jgi:dipeptidyl aminopeptidase/acylaminoacyl peptidase
VGGPGQPARRITSFAADDALQLYGLALNRDATTLAFVRGGDEDAPDDPLPNAGHATATPKQELFVASLRGDAAPSLIGEGHSAVFAPTGDRLAFTRRGEVWLWEPGAAARRLATVRGEVERLQWSLDGTRLLFSEDRGGHSFVALLEVAEPRLRYVDPGLGFSVEPVFSPDGRQVAFIRFVDAPANAATDSGPYWSIRATDLATGKSRAVWTAPSGPGARYYESRGRDLFWSADGLLVFPWERSGWTHVYAVDAARGGTPAALTPGNYEVDSFLLGADGRSLVYAANAGNLNRRHVWRRPLKGGAAEQLTRGDGIESFPTYGGNALAVIATGVASPAFPALLGRRLTPLGTRHEARGFVTPEAVLFRAEDGVEVHAQLFRARGGGKRPAVVYIHGGPRRQMMLGFHPSGYYSKAYAFNQRLAAAGYHVLAVNYRSGTGYGAAFRSAAGTGREGASEYRDILAAGRWLAARAEVDAARIGIWGGSWGGYLAALGLARNSDLFASGVDFHGVHSLLRPVPNSYSPDAQLAAQRLQWESSPLGAIEGWRSPVLLIHGDDDRNVDFSQSLLLARELAARRIPHRALVFPNERHTFQLHSKWLESFRAAEAFLDQTLKRKEPLQ